MRELFHRVANNVLVEFRILRSRYLGGIAERCATFGLTADVFTGLSFVSGIAAVYFLFDNSLLFFLFGVLHLFFDGFDGVVARTAKDTRYGAYVDSFNDQFIATLLLAKMTLVSQNVVLLILTVLYVFELAIYMISKFRVPMLFVRTFVLLSLMFQLYTLGIIISGLYILYNLVLLLRYHFTSFHPKKKAI